MWKQLIEKLSPDHEFFPPALWADVTIAGEKLGVAFPDDLKNLLRETNGVHGEYGLGLIWPVERIVKENLDFRTRKSFKELYMPFDSLLFFADAGNGDQFAFPIRNGLINRLDVFVWTHEDDSRKWVARSLAKYLEWWLDGRIELSMIEASQNALPLKVGARFGPFEESTPRGVTSCPLLLRIYPVWSLARPSGHSGLWRSSRTATDSAGRCDPS